jgi:hypothetical protein
LIGNRLEQDIVGLYNHDIAAALSINQISNLLGKKYPYINHKVNALINTGVLTRNIIGRSHLCTINTHSDEGVQLLSLNEISRRDSAIKKDKSIRIVVERLRELQKHADILTAVKHGKKLIVVLGNDADAINVEKSSTLKTHNLVCTRAEDFRKSLVNDSSLIYDRIVLLGFENFFTLLSQVENDIRVRRSPVIP